MIKTITLRVKSIKNEEIAMLIITIVMKIKTRK